MSTFGKVVNVSTLSGKDGFLIGGEKPGDLSGNSVSTAGDINGDGFDDFIVSAFRANANGLDSGASYVVFGKSGAFNPTLNLSELNGSNGFQLKGESAYDYFGASVSSAGDLNGDGFDDLIVGANGADPNGTFSGASYVVFGKASGFSANLNVSTLNGNNGFQINGETSDDRSGRSVSLAGDVNGDGFDDLIIGSYRADPNGSQSGASYVVFGKVGGFGPAFDLGALTGSNGFRINGEAAGDRSGFSVSTAGDVNGDGFDDLIVGASRADANGEDSGASYVVFGKAGGFSSELELSGLNGSNGFKINGQAQGDLSGYSVAAAGDVNGDGFGDVIIGSTGASGNGNFSGSSYVVFGKSGGFSSTLELSALTGTNGFKINGASADDNSGSSVASAGDVNGDGFDDLLIGVSLADPNGFGSGSTYVVFGKAGGFTSTLNLATLSANAGFKLNGEGSGDRFGGSVASAGDVNGDGFDDLIVGASRADPNGNGSGASYIIFGKATNGTAGNEVLKGSAEGDSIQGFNGNDAIFGVDGADTIRGGNDNDRIYGGRGADKLYGGSGNDQVYGGDGSDVLFGQGGTNSLYGGLGNDIFFITNRSTSIRDGGGVDEVRALFTINMATSGFIGVENARLTGSLSASLFGNGGANFLVGNSGNNALNGGAGNDRLNGGGGVDVMRGGTGNDVYLTDGRDTIIEGFRQGTDTVLSSANYRLSTNVENLTLTGSSAINGTGNALSNVLRGNSGANTLAGGFGNDTMTGGAGRDTFVFNGSLGTNNVDRINDFNVVADTIGLEDSVFTGLSKGQLSGSAFTKNTSGVATDSADRIIYETDTGHLYFDSDGTGGVSRVQFGTIGANLALTSADFQLI